MNAKELDTLIRDTFRLCDSQHIAQLANWLAALEQRVHTLAEKIDWVDDAAVAHEASHSPAPAEERGETRCKRCGSTDRALDANFHCSTCYAEAIARAERAEALYKTATSVVVSLKDQLAEWMGKVAALSISRDAALADAATARRECEKYREALQYVRHHLQHGGLYGPWKDSAKAFIDARYKAEVHDGIYTPVTLSSSPPPATGEKPVMECGERCDDDFCRDRTHLVTGDGRFHPKPPQPSPGTKVQPPDMHPADAIVVGGVDVTPLTKPSPGSPHITESGYLVHLTTGGGNVKPSPEKGQGERP